MMKKSFLILALSLFSANLFAVELYCAGRSQTDASQRGIEIDCTDRNEVIEYLRGGWQALRKNNIGGSMEDLCWKSYKTAKEIHPAVNPRGWASTMLAQCNVALRYIK